MTYSKEWLALGEADENLRSARFAFFQNKEQMMRDLYIAVGACGLTRLIALRFLNDFHLDFLLFEKLLPQVVDIAVDSGDYTAIGLAKDLIYSYRHNNDFKVKLIECIHAYLKMEDDWHFRRIAEIYEQLAYKEELAKLIAICKASADKEIVEIGEDFSPES